MTAPNITLYRFECMNSYIDGLRRAEDFSSEKEAIETASNYEATLTRLIYHNGECIASELLYDPKENI